MSKVPDEVWVAFEEFADSICKKMRNEAERYSNRGIKQTEERATKIPFDEAKIKIIENGNGTIVDEFNLTGVVFKPLDPGEVIFTKHLADKIWGDSPDFNMDVVLDQIEDYGKYKGILMCNGDKSENYIPVSVARQIVRGRGLSGVLGYLKEENNVPELL